MRIKIIHTSVWLVLLCITLGSCQDKMQEWVESFDSDVNIINVGVDVSGLTISSDIAPISPDHSTRASDGERRPAEEVSWLVQPLKQGLDITYGKVADLPADRRESVAILKLQGPDGNNEYEKNDHSGLAIYTFQYRTDQHNAKWYDNGPHYFEGVHVPNRIRYSSVLSEMNSDRQNFNGATSVKAVTNLISDQSGNVESGTDNDLSNYYLLAHYLGMPANTRVSATVSRILLPFRHRLAHVLAYIIIDPSLGAKINGYENINVNDADNDDNGSGDGSNDGGDGNDDNNDGGDGNDDNNDGGDGNDGNNDGGDGNEGNNDGGDGNDGNNDGGDGRSTPQLPFRDDPNTSSIRFCNVDVLQGVHDVYDATTGLHTLTPTWKEKERKVIPHFYEQAAELVVYETDKKKLYPKSDGYDGVNKKYVEKYQAEKTAGKTDAEAAKAAQSHCGGYVQKVYNAVPVYDLIVRPTYTSYDNVMYDEVGYGNETDRRALANNKNQIDFQVGLDNGLNYQKHFEFDLDANYETVVYLQISREGVDYNASGSVLWQEETRNDEWYGLDNTNGHTLSQAGSTWQRAYYNRPLSYDDKITDGGFYDERTNTGEDGTAGQYLTETTWKEYFSQAFLSGEHHGDYFVLAQDITIDATSLPADGLVFTGHLDGFNTHNEQAYHKITLTNAGKVVTCTNEPLSKLYQDTGATIPVPQLYWQIEVAETKPRKAQSIPFGVVKINMDETLPEVLTQLDNQGKTIIYLDDNTYREYPYRTFYKKSPNYLFAGLDGIYETNQERGGTPWEANVHKEGNYWLPYRDISDPDPSKHTGWRAEVMNLTVVGGTLFKDDAVITGNVSNCKDGDGTNKVPDHIPAMPKYK